MKTVKVPEKVHQELKIFVANNPKEKVSDFAGFAIMNELKERGHVFKKGNKKKFIGEVYQSG